MSKKKSEKPIECRNMLPEDVQVKQLSISRRAFYLQCISLIFVAISVISAILQPLYIILIVVLSLGTILILAISIRDTSEIDKRLSEMDKGTLELSRCLYYISVSRRAFGTTEHFLDDIEREEEGPIKILSNYTRRRLDLTEAKDGIIAGEDVISHMENARLVALNFGKKDLADALSKEIKETCSRLQALKKRAKTLQKKYRLTD